MKGALAVVVVSACSRGEPPPAAAPPPPPPPVAKLAGCTIARPAPQVQPTLSHGTASGYGIGGCGGHHERSEAVPQTKIDSHPTTAGIAPEIYRRYIKRNAQKFNYCYEKQLLADPSLGGAVTTHVEIAGDGIVTKATANGVSPLVAQCFVDVLREIEFPKPTASSATADLTFQLSAPGSMSGGAGSATAERVEPWTPYARGRLDTPDDVPAILESAATAIAARAHDVDACFGAATGSSRALVILASSGEVVDVRAGGLGDARAEACLAKALRPIHVATSHTVELACDFDRGAPRPWRVTRDPSWLEIDVDKAGGHLAGDSQLLETASDDYLKTHGKDAPGALVIADRDAPGVSIAKAASWVNGLPNVLVAVRDASGAPELVALGHSDLTHRAAEDGPGIAIDAAGVRVCPKHGDTGAVERTDAAIAKLSPCSSADCPTVTLAITGGTGAELAATAAAARRRGLERIVLDSSTCP